jgi:peroxiredoxin
MTINVGDSIPNETVFVMSEDGSPQAITTHELFKEKRVVMFGIIGAFTPTCSTNHLPGFTINASAFREKYADDIICLSVNDIFVMTAWGMEQNVGNNLRMVSDGSATFVTSLGLGLDLAKFGQGMRCQRFSMIVENSIVKILQREDPPMADLPAADLTSAETLLKIMANA